VQKTNLVWPQFLACDSIYAIAHYMLSPVRLSVRPSVRHTGGSVKDGWS